MKNLREFAHSASRDKGVDLDSDRPGHYQSHGNGHGAYNPATTPKQNEAQHFAIELAKELEQGRSKNEFQRLILVSPPAFMGMLNNHIGNHLRHLVTDSFEKDYTRSTEKELAGHLENCIFL